MDVTAKCKKCDHQVVDHMPHGKEILCPEQIIDLSPYMASSALSKQHADPNRVVPDGGSTGTSI